MTFSKAISTLFPFAFFISAWQRRELLRDLVWRDVSGRYKGSLIGVLWSLVTPILMLGVYTFVFNVIFKVRWGGLDSRSAFALNVFVGMIAHGLLAECLNRAPTLIVSNVNFVKKVVFPLEILSWMSLGSATFHATVSLGVLLVFAFFVNGGVSWSFLSVILVLLPIFLWALGVSWFLASLGVFLRDVAQLTGLLSTLLLFLSPVFYPASALPRAYGMLLYLNPLTFVIEQMRRVLIEGLWPDWAGLLGAIGIGWCAAMAGYYWFEKTRKGFADVL